MNWRTKLSLAILLVMTSAARADASAAAAASQPVATPAAIQDKGYRLIQNWDFSQKLRSESALREQFHTRYVYANGSLDHLNKEWQRYRDNDNHQFVDGSLALVANVVGEMKSGQIESGMLRSRWSGKYGYFEASVQVPPGRGMWPAFWLNPQDATWPPEIDIMEIVNNGRDDTRRSFHFLHGKSLGATDSSRLDRHHAYLPGIDFASGFHTFAVEWTADTVTHYVDDVPVVSRKFQWRHDDGQDGGDAHVLLNLAVGGSWPGPPNDLRDFPAALKVRYIRVWQRTDAVDNK